MSCLETSKRRRFGRCRGAQRRAVFLAGASQHWKRVTEFVAERVDDPARVAVYAYVKEYTPQCDH